ncbi:MAG: O-antigen ligase family protein [Planctomycetota bacterium]|jgi:O-antigen ligase
MMGIQTVKFGAQWKCSPSFCLVAIMGIIYGTFIFQAGGLAPKWFLVVSAPMFFIILCKILGSLQKTMLALLIFSLSILMDVHLGFSDKYASLQSGMPISLTSLLLLGLYIHKLFNPGLRDGTIHLFPWVTIPFGVLVLWSGLSFVVAAKPSYVLFQFPRALEAFFIFFYAANFLRSEEKVLFVIKCLAVTVAFTGILGLSQYFAGSSFNLQFLGGRESQIEMDYYTANISRVSGFVGHPNNLGFFLSGWLPVLLVCGIGIGKFRLRLLCLFSFALGLVTLVLTYSRGGWLGFIFSLVLIAGFLMMKQVRKKFHGTFLPILILSLTAAVLILPFFSKIITRLTKDDYGAAYSRISMAQTGLKIVRDNWVTGVGLGNYEIAIWDYDSDPAINSAGQVEPVHNIYLHTAAELGILALIILIWVSLVFFHRGIYALRAANKTTALFAMGLMVGLAGLYLHGMVELGTLGHPRFVPLSFIGGCLVGLNEIKLP